jgi:hypothetical protein
MKSQIVKKILSYSFFLCTAFVYSQESLNESIPKKSSYEKKAVPGVLGQTTTLSEEKKLDSIIRVCVRKIDKDETLENMKWSANMMERVTKMNNCWSSNYYLCYFHLITARLCKNVEEKNVYYNSFYKSYNILESFTKSNNEKSELLTLMALLKIDILLGDPLKYGKELGPEIIGLFNEALLLNPINPRAIYLNAIFKSRMANFFNKKENYYDSFLIANKEFVKAFSQANNYLMPLWGAESNCEILIKSYDSLSKKLESTSKN